MFQINCQPPFLRPAPFPFTFPVETEMHGSGNQTVYEQELTNKFDLCRKNLLMFLRTVNTKNDLKVNFRVIKRYYKMPFDDFPDSQEIMKTFEKITQRISINKSQQKNWYQEDIMLLTWLVVKYSFFKLTDVKLLKDQEWNVIAEIIPFKSAEQCKFKWLSLERLNLQEKPWTIEEDKILKALVLDNPTKKWTEVAKLLFNKSGGVVYRAGKFCRERWNNYLTPDLKKGSWLITEDIDLLEKVIRIGKKWSEISRLTPGRTENGVKNRFNSLMKKWLRKHSYSTTDDDDIIISDLYKNLLENQSKNESDITKKEIEAFVTKNQSTNKRVVHLEEVGEKQEFNLLFELLKSDIGNKAEGEDEKMKLLSNMKQDLQAFEKILEKKSHSENDQVNVKKEENGERTSPTAAMNRTLPNMNYGAGFGMWPNCFQFNTEINPWILQQQQFMMGMMMQQNLARNIFMSGLLKQENN